MDTTPIDRITDVAVGDTVTPLANIDHFGEQAAALKGGDTYTVMEVHRLGGGGTLSLKGVENPVSLSDWPPGSFGFALFAKVKDDRDAALQRAIKRADDNYADLTKARVERDALRSENERLTEQVAHLNALRTYVQDNLLTDDQIAACAGFTHGYLAGGAR